MGDLTLDAQHPGLLDALGDVDAMCLWEAIRVQRSPATLPELSALTGIAAGTVQTLLDRLAEAGLVRSVRARKPRNSVGYVVTTQPLVVAFDHSDDAMVARIKEISRKWERHAEHLIGNHGAADACRNTTFRSRYVGIDQLDPADFAELRRRIERVCEFWNMLAGKNGGTDEAGRRRRRGNHAISIRVEPLDHAALPNPEVWFRPRAAADRAESSMRGRRARRPLTAREAEVARGLASGLQRRQLAQHLGVSIHTLTTMCKRIYAKLGVHSQAELAAQMHAEPRAM